MLALASPIQRHISICSPLSGSEDWELSKPQRQEALSMKEGILMEDDMFVEEDIAVDRVSAVPCCVEDMHDDSRIWGRLV